MKNKTKTLIPLIIILSLFLSGMNITSETTVSDIDYPNSVRKGDIFDIVIAFDYAADCNCLYGDYIYLWYSLAGDAFAWSCPEIQPVAIPQVDNKPSRPTSISISVNTSAILTTIDEDVTFHFAIKYDTGIIYDIGLVEIVVKDAAVFTDWYKLTIDNTILNTNQLIYVSVGSAVVGLLLIVLVIYLIKKRRN